MLFLAASFALALQGQIQPQERLIETPLKATNAYQSAAWSSIVDSVAVLPDSSGAPFGLALLIDDRGYFVAHTSSVVSQPLIAKMSGGITVQLDQLGFDKETQLILLRADEWTSGKRQPVRIAPQPRLGELMVATVKGPVPAQLTSLNRPGLFLPSMRFSPLAEIQLESKDVPVGGGIVFDNAGGLIGIMGAVLNLPDSGVQSIQNVRNNADQFGPAGLTVGYALGPKILARVIEGFCRDDHQVQHPSVGIFFKEGNAPGQILVDDVTPGSPCAVAGVQKGDQIVAANGTPIANIIDLAAFLFDLEPGEALTLKLYRRGTYVTATMKVGIQTNRAEQADSMRASRAQF